MESNRFAREALLIGPQGVDRLAQASVLLFGVGGVGSFVAEGLARAGVGHITLCDNDTVAESNCNRQLIALQSTLGRQKAEVMAERIRDINPQAEATPVCRFYQQETASSFDFSKYDYIIDAIDTVSSKLLLIENAFRAGVPVISSMGTGNKLDPSLFRIADITKTSVCPLARVMRRELKARGIAHCKVLFSTEPPLVPLPAAENDRVHASRRQTPGSISFVPSVAGLMIAGAVVTDLLEEKHS